jgi:tRNA modification GTPase
MIRTDLEDTIAAIASGNQPAARGVIRISGPRVLQALQQCFHPEKAAHQSPRELEPKALSGLQRATVVAGSLDLLAPLSQVRCMAYIWPTRQSYTQQPSVELHLPGSMPLLNSALRSICRFGVRLAEPGEFTLRAFLAGRLDLTQAEAVLGVIDAEDQSQLQVALKQLSGGLAQPLDHLRTELIHLLAHLEAGLDFVEEDIEFISRQQLLDQLTGILDALQKLQATMVERDHVETLPTVVLYGWPNVGKSSLFNALGRVDQAIVTDQVGTTRDYLEQTLEIDGQKIRLVDTAGIEIPAELISIKQAAQGLGQERRNRADLKLLCLDASRPGNAWECAELGRIDERTIIVLNKCDLAASPEDDRGLPSHGVVTTSATNREGLALLVAEISRRLHERIRNSGSVVAETAARSRDAMAAASEAIRSAMQVAQQEQGEEIVASELRVALEEIGRVAGIVYTDDILDRVFSQFCIGK